MAMNRKNIRVDEDRHRVLSHLATRSVPTSLGLALIGLIIIWMPDRFVRGGDNLQLWETVYQVLGFVCLCLGTACLFGKYRSRRQKPQTVASLNSPPNSAQAGFARTPGFKWWQFASIALIAVAIDGLFIHALWTTHQISLAFSMVVFVISLFGYLGYRFIQLRAEIAAGQFVAQEYWNAPARYILGPTWPLVVWIACTALVCILVTVIAAKLTLEEFLGTGYLIV
jgi:hypothetical protein